MKARVFVTLKSGVLDPQGKAIEGVLSSLGIPGIASVRQGKVFDLDIDAPDDGAATDVLRRACERLLANTVIENYRFELGDGPVVSPPANPSEDAFSPDQDVADAADPTEAADPTQAAAEHAEMPIEGHP